MSNYNSDELIHIKDGDVEYIKFKILEKYSDKLLHLITLRHGGVSRDVYKSLNFRSAGNDAVNNVLTNLEIVSKKIGINSNDVFKGRQDHTDNILTTYILLNYRFLLNQKYFLLFFYQQSP